MSLLIVTDLDGSLLDHESYSFEPAAPALKELAARGIQPILNSSKTAAEIEALQAKLRLHAPYICENGAALVSNPKQPEAAENKSFAAGRDAWLEQVHSLRSRGGFQFEGFADWSVGELMGFTGLDAVSASLAKTREYTEPILWRDTEGAKLEFQNSLQALQLQLVEGGRFISIQSNFNKATALQWLREQSAAANNSLIVALGDSPNDTAMLEAADVAVIIHSAKSSQINLTSPSTIIRTDKPGPAGWQGAMEEILLRFDKGELTSRLRN